MNALVENRLSLIALLILVIQAFYLYGMLPEEVITNFPELGEEPEILSRNMAVLLVPGIFAFALLLTTVAVALSPEKLAMTQSKGARDQTIFGVGLLCFFLQIGILLNDGQFDFFARQFTYGSVGFLLIAGNVIGKLERNLVLGLRLPGIMNSDENWRRAHRLVGKYMVVAGIVLLLSSIIYVNLWLTVSLMAGAIVFPIVWLGLVKPKSIEQP